MWWVTAIQIGLQLFGARKQAKSGGEAKEIGRLNAVAQRLETQEQVRRELYGARQQEGYARAVAGASGFSVQTGTSQFNYIKEMVAENTRQRSFTQRAGNRKAEILLKQGDAAASMARSGALGSYAGAVGSFGSMWSDDTAPWNKAS